MAEMPLRSWWTDVEHLRDGYEYRSGVPATASTALDDVTVERDDARGRGGAAVAERPRLVADLAPVDDLLAGWGAGRPAGPIVREIVIERDATPPTGPSRRGRTQAVTAERTPARTSQRLRQPGEAVAIFGQRPDRIALWALLMGIVLILVALGSGDPSATGF